MPSEQEGMYLVELVRQIAKDVLKNYNNTYIRIAPATVVSTDGTNAMVRLAYASQDGKQDFQVPIVTRQTIAVGDAVNIAYWSNLSTAILLSKG